MEYSIKKILSESNLLIEGRKEDARERYPNIPNEIFDIFVDEDPSGNHKYLMWLCNMPQQTYGRYVWSFNSNDARNLMEKVKYFHEKNSRFEKKDVRPTTHATSCYYVSGTRWCTTMKDYANYFKNYYKDGSLFYFINKNTGKKRAFFTYLQDTFLTPQAVSGDSPNDLGRTHIYTETDSRGRSLRGIPVQGLQAMNKKHEEIRKGHLETLPEDEKILKMLNWGLEIPENITSLNGDWTDSRGNGKIPSQFKKITGNYTTGSRDGITDHISLQEIGGDLKIFRSLTSFGDVERVGGNVSAIGYYSWSNDSNKEIQSIGNLKYVGGNFHWEDFPNLPLSEVVKIQYINKLSMSRTQFNNNRDELLSKELSLPGLPGVKIYKSDAV
jgi:hypothetical protein